MAISESDLLFMVAPSEQTTNRKWKPPFCESSARARANWPPSSPGMHENTEKLRCKARLSSWQQVLDFILSTARATKKAKFSVCS